jgi:two-component system sensor histidine kinase VicK
MAVEDKDAIFRDIRHIGKLSHDGVFIYVLNDQRFLYINQAFVSIVEIGSKLLMDQAEVIMKLLAEEDQEYLIGRFTELLEKGVLEEVQMRLRQNKTAKTISFSGYVTPDKNCVVGFVKDISKPKQHEDYLLKFGARKDAVMDTVAQNLITPLNLSNFTVDYIEKAIREKKFNRLESHIAVMREVTSQCIQIISDLIQEEHLESPAVHTKSTRFDLIEQLMIVLEKLRESNPDKRFKVQSDANHLLINGDDLKFMQVIHNLLSNAIKFTPPVALIETMVRHDGDWIRISVKDNGIGIPKDLQPYVFEKNTRASRPGLNGEKSNGIGLHVCQKLANLMGGSITLRSAEDHGTTVTFHLPKR